MTDKKQVSAIAIHGVHFVDVEGKQAAKAPTDGVFKMPAESFAELEAMGAVRKATKADAEDASDDLAPPNNDPGLNLEPRTFSTEEAAALAPKHKGGGKFVVVLGDQVVSENDDGKGYDGKDAAESWIVEQRRLAEDAANDLLK